MTEINGKERELFIRYGSACSEAMFDFPCKFFKIPECQGVIAYRNEYGCAIVFGDPLCPPEERETLTKAFHQFCEESNLSIIYIIISEDFAKWVQRYCSILIGVCDEFIFNPQNDPLKTSKRLRHRVDRAKKHGLTVHEYIPVDKDIEKALTDVGIQWREAIKGPNIFLGHLDFFENYTGKRWFYVKDQEKITSMIMLSKIEASKGWLLKFLVTGKNAFPDTSEFLVTSVLDILRKEGCQFLSKGTLPVEFLNEIEGMGNFSVKISKSIYKLVSWLFKLKKRKEYWMRYNPEVKPAYLVLSKPRIGINEARALMKVFRTSLID